MFMIVGWQFGFVAPWSKLMLLVSVRWTSPDLDVNVTLVSGHRLIVSGKQKQEC